MVVSNHIAHIVISEHQVCKLSIMYISLINRSVHVDDVHKYTKKRSINVSHMNAATIFKTLKMVV